MVRALSILCCSIAAASIKTTLAFLPHQRSLSPSLHRCRSSAATSKTSSSSLTPFPLPTTRTIQTTDATNVLAATSSNNGNGKPVEITFPTPEAAASMGIRDWPQQFHSTSWSDSVSEGSIATRYVLDGKGRVTIDYYDDAGERQRIKNQRVYPGTLVEVDGEANLLWEVDDAKEGMIVLTPSYEEGGKLLVVGGFLLVFCAGLLIGGGL